MRKIKGTIYSATKASEKCKCGKILIQEKYIGVIPECGEYKFPKKGGKTMLIAFCDCGNISIGWKPKEHEYGKK